MTPFPPNQNQRKFKPQNRYAHGFKWCGRCGEWRKVDNAEIANRCPDCNYMMRKDALLKGQRRPHLVVRI